MDEGYFIRYSTGVNTVGVYETSWSIPVNELPERYELE